MGKFQRSVCLTSFTYEKELYVRHSLFNANAKKKALLCIFCNKEFLDKTVYLTHITSHTLEHPYFCKLCPLEFRSTQGLKRHQDQHDSERRKDAKCGDCGKSFFNLNQLQIHQKRHTMSRPFSCDICKNKFKLKVDLRLHMATHVKESHPCNVCGKIFARLSYLRNHQVIHAGSSRRRYYCQFCPANFLFRSGRKSHIQRYHRKGEAKKFECEKCKRIFFNRAELKQHSRIHFGKTPFACNLCNLNFRTEQELNCHKEAPSSLNGHDARKFIRPVGSKIWTRIAKNGELPYECIFCKKMFRKKCDYDMHIVRHIRECAIFCPLCPLQFNSISTLSKHLPKHNPNRTRDFSCEVCGKKSYSKGDLNKHKITHLTEKPFECEVCKKAYKSKDLLRGHAVVHKGKFISCNICGKKFIRGISLRRHISSHTGENRNSVHCEFCPKKFTSTLALRRHLMVAHNSGQQKEFKCTKCKKEFFTNGELQGHLYVHTNLKAFFCDLCTKSYKCRSNLFRHKRTNHPNEK